MQKTKTTPRTRAASADEADYISVDALAATLGVHHSTVRREINAGRIPAFKIGRVIRIPRAVLADLEPAAPWAVA